MKSIASKLWLGMMLLVGIVLILLWLFQIVFLQSFYADLRISGVKSQGQDVVEALRVGTLKSGEQTTRLDQLAQQNNLTVQLVDANGKELFSSSGQGAAGQMPMMMNNYLSQAFNEALAGREVSYNVTHPRMNTKFVLMGLPVVRSGKVQQVLLLTMPMAPVNETADILKKQLFYITLILLAVAVAFSYILSRMLTRPIKEITRVSAKMAAGELSARINLKNQDELGRLAGTINYMGQELGKLDQLRKDLVANVSHELRTPLSLIRGYAETIRDVSGNDPVKRDKQLGVIIDETERLGEIVSDILNLSQMQAGYHTLDKKPLAVDRLLTDTVKRFEVLAGAAQVTISLENSSQARLAGDETRIQQVLYNLIHNAVNHTPPGSTVVVRGAELGGKLRISVSDNGPGIPEDELKYIWDRFYKANKTGNRKSSGSGLGLAIVKSILEAHGFAYGVDSQPGSGTTFWFEAGIIS